MTKQSKWRTIKPLAWLAIILWILGFALAFVFKPGSLCLWIPDTLLLLGFWPLFMNRRLWWLWILFGLVNFAIGFILRVSQILPDKDFHYDRQLLIVKDHLGQYHVPSVWMTIGAISCVVGITLLIINLTSWITKSLKKSPS